MILLEICCSHLDSVVVHYGVKAYYYFLYLTNEHHLFTTNRTSRSCIRDTVLTFDSNCHE